jgi:hypothetical protein
MAGLRGYNGKIVIDEGEASRDVRNIEEARGKIAEAQRMLDSGKIDDARFFGAGRDALNEALAKIVKELGNLDGACGSSKKFINDTVAKYQRIDRELRNSMKGA